MININVKLNNGTNLLFKYDNLVNVNRLITDIGKKIYLEKYNQQVNSYIKIIYLGKILDIEEDLPLNNSTNDYIFHSVIKKIPDEVFIKEENIEIEKVNDLFQKDEFINIIRKKLIYEFIIKNLSEPNKIIELFLNKKLNKYNHQLLLLKDMGFNDEKELLQLLDNSNGNIETVINILMT